MRVEEFTVPKWQEFGGGTHSVVRCTFASGEAALQTALGQSKQLASKVHSASPGGRTRGLAEIHAACLCGLLSEEAFSEAVALQNARLGTNVRVTFKKFDLPESQIDVSVERSAGDIFDIEIRSSGHFKQNLEEIYNEDFKIIGPYTTSTKPAEVEKPYYVQALYPFRKEEILERVDSDEDIEVCIAGGATKEMLSQSGTYDSLGQWGAKYRVIKPIVQGLDANAIIAAVMGVVVSDMKWP